MTLSAQDNLLVRARLEAEDAQRVLLGALNGLAGIMLLDGKRAEAVATFREVLAIGARLAVSAVSSTMCPGCNGARHTISTCSCS